MSGWRTHNTRVLALEAAGGARPRRAAMRPQVYLTSANGLAETGEIINIDGVGNRVASHAVRPREGLFCGGPEQAGAHL